MGLATAAKRRVALKEQADRISACTLKFCWEDDKHEAWARGAIVTSGLRFKVPENTQGTLWEDRVVLDEVFWKALRDHPVPLLETAIRKLRDRSMSLDIYVWLAWRCHRLSKPTAISWLAVHSQFGVGFKAVKHFKPSFLDALAAATAAYPEARVDVGEGVSCSIPPDLPSLGWQGSVNPTLSCPALALPAPP